MKLLFEEWKEMVAARLENEVAVTFEDGLGLFFYFFFFTSCLIPIPTWDILLLLFGVIVSEEQSWSLQKGISCLTNLTTTTTSMYSEYLHTASHQVLDPRTRKQQLRAISKHHGQPRKMNTTNSIYNVIVYQ